MRKSSDPQPCCLRPWRLRSLILRSIIVLLTSNYLISITIGIAPSNYLLSLIYGIPMNDLSKIITDIPAEHLSLSTSIIILVAKVMILGTSFAMLVIVKVISGILFILQFGMMIAGIITITAVIYAIVYMIIIEIDMLIIDLGLKKPNITKSTKKRHVMAR